MSKRDLGQHNAVKGGFQASSDRHGTAIPWGNNSSWGLISSATFLRYWPLSLPVLFGNQVLASTDAPVLEGLIPGPLQK